MYNVQCHLVDYSVLSFAGLPAVSHFVEAVKPQAVVYSTVMPNKVYIVNLNK